MSPLVSIGMPVYNGEEFLGEALDSWLAQRFSNFELIVSDNASTDATPRILKEYAARDSRIRVVTRQKTVIVWDNFNGLLDEATAPFFAWAACDDLRHPDFLGRVVRALDAQPDAVAAYALARFFGDPRREKRRAETIDDTPGDEAEPLARIIAMLRSRQWHICYGLLRVHALRKTRLFHYPMGFNADVGLCIELATYGRLHCVDEPLVKLRMHPKALSINPYESINADPGRRFDVPAREFVESLNLPDRQRRLVAHQVEVWCKKAEKPRRGLWKLSGFRSAFVHGAQAWIDLQRLWHRV